jgi:hypothetical protein
MTHIGAPVNPTPPLKYDSPTAPKNNRRAAKTPLHPTRKAVIIRLTPGMAWRKEERLKMTQYLITNARTLAETWTAATTGAQALVAHETARRAADGDAPLPRNCRVSHHGDGGIVSMSIGDSFIRGRVENVVREG